MGRAGMLGLAMVALSLAEAGCLVQITHVADPRPIFDQARAEAERLSGRPGRAHELNVLVWNRDDRGDREALGPLMERHQRRLYRLALSYLRDPDEALDAVQEIFVKAYQNAPRWDGGAEVGPWLTRVAINHSIDRYRRGRRRLA